MLSQAEIDAIESSALHRYRRLSGDTLFLAAAYADKHPGATPRQIADYLRVPLARVLRSWEAILALDPSGAMPSKEYTLVTVAGQTILTVRRQIRAVTTTRPVFSRERRHGNKTSAEISRAVKYTARG